MSSFSEVGANFRALGSEPYQGHPCQECEAKDIAMRAHVGTLCLSCHWDQLGDLDELDTLEGVEQ